MNIHAGQVVAVLVFVKKEAPHSGQFISIWTTYQTWRGHLVNRDKIPGGLKGKTVDKRSIWRDEKHL